MSTTPAAMPTPDVTLMQRRITTLVADRHRLVRKLTGRTGGEESPEATMLRTLHAACSRLGLYERFLDAGSRVDGQPLSAAVAAVLGEATP